MLYQFIDRPCNTSIQQIIRKRSKVLDSLVIFMSDFSYEMYLTAMKLGYQAGGFTFINILGANHTLGKDQFTIDQLTSNNSKFQLIKKDENTLYYMYNTNIFVKVRLDKENVLSVTYSYHDYTQVDYYAGKLLYSKKKYNNSDTVTITFYDNQGNIFYTSSKDDNYIYKGIEYHSKKDFYNQLLSEYQFTHNDVLSLDWCFGFQSIICENKKKAKVVAALYSEIFHSSSLYPRKAFYDHNHTLTEYKYMAKKLINVSDKPYCDLKVGIKFATDNEHDVDAIYAQTEKMKDILEHHMEAGLISKKEVQVYKMLDYQITPNRSKGNKKICAVSRLSPEKRIDWIIKSVFFAHSMDPKITLDIYGNGKKEIKEGLETLVKELHAEEYITFKGWLEDKTTMADYALFMNVSLTEGYPLSVQEALSCGCPIVGSDIVGHSELNKRCSILVDFEGKPENNYCIELAKAIIEAFNRFEELNRGAIEFTEENLNQEVVDTNIKKLFSV